MPRRPPFDGARSIALLLFGYLPFFFGASTMII
jgi:hypothetical protein